MTSINPSDFKLSNIEKDLSTTGQKLIKISGTFQGHDVTLIITLDRNKTRDEIIKKIKSHGLKIERSLGESAQFLASTGDAGKSVPLNVQIASSEKSFNVSQIVGSKLLPAQEAGKKVAQKHLTSRKSGYTALAGTPEGTPKAPDVEKGKATVPLDAIAIDIPPINVPPGDIPLSHQLKPLPSRPPPRSVTSMIEEIVKCPYFRADLNPMKAADALKDPRNPPGAVIVTKSYNPQICPFVATVKLPDGTVSQNLITIDQTAHNNVYRVSDEHKLAVKVGAGTGYANIVDCLTALSRYEMARVPPKPPPFTAIEQEMIRFRSGLEGRAGQLFHELQGLKGPLSEMGCKAPELDFILTNLCYNIAAFERSGQKGFRIRKNVSAFHQLGLALPFTCFLDSKPGNQGVVVHMTTPGVVQGAVIGQGSYKVVKTNYDIDIPAAGSSQKPLIFAKEQVLVRAKKGTEANVIKGVDLMKQLRQEIGPDVIPAIFSERRYWSKKGKERYEFNQIRFHGDFDKVIREGQLPLRTASPVNQAGPAGMRKFAFADKLNALVEVTGKISRFHAAGYIHRDVKPPNMLIQFVPSYGAQPPRTVAIPADYDFTRKAGFEETSVGGKKYAFWDPCARIGIITPNCDVFGLTYSLGMAIFPRFYAEIQSKTQLDANKDFAPLMFNKTYLKLEELGVKDRPLMLELVKNMGAQPPFTAYCKMVNEALDQLCHQENLPIEKVEEIRRFQSELAILPDLWGLIGRVFNSSDELLRDVQARNDLMQKLKSKDPDEAREAANEVTRMAAQKGIPTAEQLGEYLKSVQRIMSSSSMV